MKQMTILLFLSLLVTNAFAGTPPEEQEEGGEEEEVARIIKD